MSRASQRTYRRRRAVAGTVLVALAAAAVIALDSALGNDRVGPSPEQIERHYMDAIPEKALIGQRLMVRMDGEATPELVRQARRGEIGGVIVFPALGQSPEAVAKQVKRLQRATEKAGLPPLLVSTDQEGGEVKRFPDGPPAPTPADLGAAGKPAAARKAGRQTGSYLAGLGINVDLAPVLDVPSSDISFMSSRAFSRDANAVGTIGVAFARGLERGGALPAPKHFPGLGRAVANTDLERSEIDASDSDMAADLKPFEDAIAAGVPLIMVGNAIYPAYDADAPAALSSKVVDGLLREQLGFGGAVISDDLGAGAIQQTAPEDDATVEAAAAGVDVLLFAKTADGSGPAEALLKATKDGKLDRGQLEDSFTRVLKLKDSVSGSR